MGLNLNTPGGVGALHKIRPDFQNQHTWAQIYLPGSGWVEIDPGQGARAYFLPAQLIQNSTDFQNYVIWIRENGTGKQPDWEYRGGKWYSPYGIENRRTFRAVDPVLKPDTSRLERLHPMLHAIFPAHRNAALSLSVHRPADDPAKLGPNSDKEPMAEKFSLERGARFLDTVSVNWTRSRKCGTCHTNYAHMMAGPTVEKPASPELVEVRAFFEARAAGWDKPEKSAKPIRDGEIVATAAALAFNDAASTGKLHPLTRAALDRMWTIQRPDGAWNWFDCDLPPMEDDDYYGTALAAAAVGHAPGDYKSTEAARKGIEKVRGYLRATPAPNLHHRALLLWASMGIDGLMDAERARADGRRPAGQAAPGRRLEPDLARSIRAPRRHAQP